MPKAPGPHQHGFDDYQTQIEDGGERSKLISTGRLYRDGGTILLRNDKRVPKSDPYYAKHWEDCNGDYACETIGNLAKSSKPFFINLWWYIPHQPIEPSPAPFMDTAKNEPRTELRKRKAGGKTEYSSMIAHLDENVGKVLKKLDELGIRDNTIIIFTSDNGGERGAFNGGLKGGKRSYFEGGIRVPAIFSWPGHFAEKSVTHYIGHSNDLLPTICDLVGAPIPNTDEIDGISLKSILTNSQDDPDRGLLFWASSRKGNSMRDQKNELECSHLVRDNDWKLCWLKPKGKQGAIALYNIKNDPQETNNLIHNPEHRERISLMEKALLEHLKEKSMEPEKRDENQCIS